MKVIFWLVSNKVGELWSHKDMDWCGLLCPAGNWSADVWDHDCVAIQQVKLKMKTKKLFLKLFLWWLFDIFSCSIIISMISLQFQGEFFIVCWNLWLIKVEMEAGSPHWGLLFGFVNPSAHMKLSQYVTVVSFQQYAIICQK